MVIPSITSLAQINDGRSMVVGFERTLLLELDAKIEQELREGIKGAWEQAESGRRSYDGLPKSKEEQEQYARFQRNWEAWKKDHLTVMALIDSGSLAEARDYSLTTARLSAEKAEEILEEMIDYNDGESRTAQAASLAESGRSQVALAVTIVAALVFSHQDSSPATGRGPERGG